MTCWPVGWLGVAAARAQAQRWARLVEFHTRRGRDFRVRTAVSPHHTLTPRAETLTEVSGLWGWRSSRRGGS